MRTGLFSCVLAAGLLLSGAPLALSGERKVEVLQTGTDYAEARLGGRAAVIRVRYARINGVRRWQVQVPGGGWRNCGHSCTDWYRCNVLEPWVCRMEDSGGKDWD